MNLALTLEQAGQVDEAIQTYRTALEVYPGTWRAFRRSRLEVTSGKQSEELPGWLDAIALQSETQVWRAWAVRERTRDH